MNTSLPQIALVCALIVWYPACFAQGNPQPASAGAAAAGDPALEKIQRDIIGSWIVDVTGVARPLTLTIRGAEGGADGVWILDATFGFTDGGKSAVKAKVQLVSDVYKLEFINTNGTVYTAEGAGNGTLTGSNAPRGSSGSPIKLARVADDDMKQRVANLQAARAALLIKPGPDVPESCARFFGGWAGSSRIDVGPMRLWVLGIKADCTAQVWYRAPSTMNTPPTDGFITVKVDQGALSLPCGNSGTCVYEVHGDEVRMNYTNPFGGRNDAVLQRIK